MPQFRHNGLGVPSIILSDRYARVYRYFFFAFQPIAPAAFVTRITIIMTVTIIIIIIV